MTLPWAGQCGEEEAFTAEDGGLDLADVLHVKLHAGLIADDAAGVDAQLLACLQLALHQRAPGVGESETLTFQLLHDETFAAEEAGADLALQRDADGDTFRAAEEGILLHMELATQLREIDGDDLAGIGGGESQRRAPAALVLVHGHEKGFAGEQALACAHQLAQETAATLVGAVTEDGVHVDAGLHVHHAASLGHDSLARIENDVDVLHVVAVNGVVNDVHGHVRGSLF